MARSRKKSNVRVGQLPPRYSFALNPYKDARFSSCPQCTKATYSRKFPLLIHVDDFGPIVLGKTCKYCSKCEIIIAHQDELEQELGLFFSVRAPQVIGNAYLVIGTVERKVWQQGLIGEATTQDTLAAAADFEKHVTVIYEPGGWMPATDAAPGKRSS